jgi:phage gp16-like protein
MAAAKIDREAARRRAAIAKIHLLKKHARLDDETYREMMGRICNGKRSAADLDQAERSALLDEFKRLGFVEGNVHAAKLDDFGDMEPQARLIRALWADLAKIGALRNSSETALRRLIKRVANVDSINWLDAHQANAVIEALKCMKQRAGFGKRRARARG